jgi:hypothetical protein
MQKRILCYAIACTCLALQLSTPHNKPRLFTQQTSHSGTYATLEGATDMTAQDDGTSQAFNLRF